MKENKIQTAMVARILRMTNDEITQSDQLTKRIMAQIEMIEPITNNEENVIAIAVNAAYYYLVVEPKIKGS